MARIVKLKFLVLSFCMLLISCKTTSEYNPRLNNFKSQFKSYVDQHIYHNPPHEHFAMAVGGEYCKGAIRSNFTKNDAINEAIDLCNSHNECNDCKVILYEDFSDFNIRAEISNIKSKRKTLANQNIKQLDQEDYYNNLIKENTLTFDSEKNANVSVANADKTIDLEILKEACESIGFTPKTENFGNCVLKLSERKDLRLVKIESTKKNDTLPSHCSELYGCPPEKYDQELEVYKHAREQIKTHPEARRIWENKCFRGNEDIEFCEDVFKEEYHAIRTAPIRPSKNKENLTKNENILDTLLGIGIVIGGAYLLGTTLTPATPPPVGTTNIFTTIIQEGPKYGSPLGY